MDTIWSISYMFVIGLRLRIDSVWHTNNLAQITSQLNLNVGDIQSKLSQKRKKQKQMKAGI